MRYHFLINVEKDPEGRNVGFFGYQQGHLLELAYAGEVAEYHGKENDQRVCNALFQIFNIGHPADYRNRSMSVGDVVLLDQSRAYSCEKVGWKQIAVTSHIQTVANPPNEETEITDEAGNVDLCEVEPAPSTRVIRVIRRIHSAEEHEARERYNNETDPGTVYDRRFGSDADNGVDW